MAILKKEHAFIRIDKKRGLDLLKGDFAARAHLRKVLGKKDYDEICKDDDACRRELLNLGFNEVPSSYIAEDEGDPDQMVPIAMLGWVIIDSNMDAVVVGGKMKHSRYYSELLKYIQQNIDDNLKGIPSELTQEGYSISELRIVGLAEQVPDGYQSHNIARNQFIKGR